jgi:hypothetical protein
MSSFAVRAQPSPCALVRPAALARGKADPHQRAANHQKLGVQTERERRKQVSNLREEDDAGVIDEGRRRPSWEHPGMSFLGNIQRRSRRGHQHWILTYRDRSALNFNGAGRRSILMVLARWRQSPLV